MSKPQELSEALLAEGERRPLSHSLQEVRSMINQQESLAHYWKRLCLSLWGSALCLIALLFFVRGTTSTAFMAIMPFVVASAMLSTIRLFFVQRSSSISRTHELLLELRTEVEELKARQN